MIAAHLFSWFQASRPAPIPDALWQLTIAELPFLQGLSAEELRELRALTEAFLADKEFTAAEPLVLTDAICLSIAVQGCLPILKLGLGW